MDSTSRRSLIQSTDRLTILQLVVSCNRNQAEFVFCHPAYWRISILIEMVHFSACICVWHMYMFKSVNSS